MPSLRPRWTILWGMALGRPDQFQPRAAHVKIFGLWPFLQVATIGGDDFIILPRY